MKRGAYFRSLSLKCPFCGGMDVHVIDVRGRMESRMLRRRRECPDCKRRFSTIEVAIIYENQPKLNVDADLVKKIGEMLSLLEDGRSDDAKAAYREMFERKSSGDSYIDGVYE
jgi:hypothetical protein